jgi:archaellum component FlaC
MDMIDDLQNEIEHLRAVCAQQNDELEDAKCLCDERLNSLDDLSAAYDGLLSVLADSDKEITRLREVIKQMLVETGNGGNKSCGDNRLTPGTIAQAKGAVA